MQYSSIKLDNRIHSDEHSIVSICNHALGMYGSSFAVRLLSALLWLKRHLYH